MKIAIVGVGTLGAEIAYSLMMMEHNNKIVLCEPHKENQRRAWSEYHDLLPVAKHTRNTLLARPDITPFADIYIITSGARRTSARQSKLALFKRNHVIVANIVKRIPRGRKVYVATNPPIEICGALKGDCEPLRECVDYAREQVGDPAAINQYIMAGKGFTQFTPAYFMALQILKQNK